MGRDKCESSISIDKLMKSLILAAILLTATIYVQPHQLAAAHNSGWHDFCFEQTLTAFDFLIDIAQALQFFFGPAIVVAASLTALILGILLSWVCNPALTPPPLSTSKAVFTQCNTMVEIDGELKGGFTPKSSKITESGPAVGFVTVKKFTPSLTYDTGQSDSEINAEFPDVHIVNGFIPFMTIVIPAAIGKALGGMGLKPLAEFVVNFIM